MAVPAIKSSFSVVSSYPSTSSKSHPHWESLSSMRFHTTPFVPTLSLKFPLHLLPKKRKDFRLQSSVESATIEENVEKSKISDSRRKLFVLNLPWSFSVVDIKNLFGGCGSVVDVEIIKQKDGKSRGFAFVTMSSGEEAQAAIEKFDSYEVSTRIIRVQFAKRFKRPPPTPTVRPSRETLHKLYVSNLAWKVRSNNLREFISTSCNPVSVRVVFDKPSGKSTGYGFVSFATKEEAKSAISVLDGKELLGRPIRLKFSEKNANASESTDASSEELEKFNLENNQLSAELSSQMFNSNLTLNILKCFTFAAQVFA